MTDQKQCNPDCKLLPMSDRYCTDCVVFQNWEQDQKQKLFRLWAAKNEFLSSYARKNYIKLFKRHKDKSISEIQKLMEADGISKEEIKDGR